MGASETKLELNGRDRVHSLFAGTMVVTSSPGETTTASGAAVVAGVPPTPDGGCLCYVVRCGLFGVARY